MTGLESANDCPECRAGKHTVCAEWSMDDHDNIVDCPCRARGHQGTYEASLMYAGTEGHSGSEASKDRAHSEAHDGTVSARQQLILDTIGQNRERGRTWHELAAVLGLHHGQITGSLSNLHKAGKVDRLNVKRGRSSVYVLPEHVNDRQTVPQGRGRGTAASPYPHALDSAHVALGPGTVATIDGAEIVWNGRRYHPLDVHDSRRTDQGAPEPEPGLFDL